MQFEYMKCSPKLEPKISFKWMPTQGGRREDSWRNNWINAAVVFLLVVSLFSLSLAFYKPPSPYLELFLSSSFWGGVVGVCASVFY